MNDGDYMRTNVREEMVRIIKTGYKTLNLTIIAEMDDSIKHKLYTISEQALKASLEVIDGNDDAKLQTAKAYVEPDVVSDEPSYDEVTAILEAARPKRNRKK